MDFLIRPLDAGDAAALQALYEECPGQFRDLLGRPAARDQAARDLAQAAQTPGRYQFAVILDGQMAGMVDCKAEDDARGTVRLGLLLMAPTYASAELADLIVRVLGRWLAAALGAQRLETGVLAHDREALALWSALGFAFTGEQYRRELPGYSPRFLVMAMDLVDA